MPNIQKIIETKFLNSPSQLQVARVLLKYGLSVKKNNAYCGGMRVAAAEIARKAGVDRRVAILTLSVISKDKELSSIFAALSPIAYLKDAALSLGQDVIEIIPQDASKPGIVSDVTRVISDAGVSIRQVITEDSHLSEEASMTIITDSKISGGLIDKIRRLEHVKNVTIYK